MSKHREVSLRSSLFVELITAGLKLTIQGEDIYIEA